MENQTEFIQNSGKINPLLKLFLLILTISGIMIYPSWRLCSILLVIIILLFRVNRVSLKLSRNRTKFIIIFSILLLIFQVLITVNGTILGFVIPQLNNFGPFFPITDYGIERGMSIASRFLLVVLSSMLFVAVTDPTLLAHSLTRLKIPYRYSFALVIALRFLPLFDSENQIVRMAQKSRGIQPEVGGFRKIIRTIQYTFFPLLVSSLSRVESLAISMDGRGFGFSENRTYFRKSNWKISDTILIVAGFGYILLCFVLAFGYLPLLSTII
ncbi:MAG: energy-coupling factor transporter transmembrane protein EcfT [Candidatus Thorarchaeota archaeon]|nr:MAG: energy-coupling factor transporter transmembrane protein EcfT [Candidatus Thorarchaeota archaeon]